MRMSLLSQEWVHAANDLGLDVVAPFKLTLSSGKEVDCDVLLRNFGHRKGMLIISDYGKIDGYTDDIVAEGYGYSTLDEPEETWIYDRGSIIALLKDWGWTGDPNDMPSWLKKRKRKI